MEENMGASGEDQILEGRMGASEVKNITSNITEGVEMVNIWFIILKLVGSSRRKVHEFTSLCITSQFFPISDRLCYVTQLLWNISWAIDFTQINVWSGNHWETILTLLLIFIASTHFNPEKTICSHKIKVHLRHERFLQKNIWTALMKSHYLDS